MHQLYLKKAEEARITAAMDRENLLNVRLVDNARVPISPIAAGVFLSLVLAAMVGLGGGMGGALALEYLRPTFHSALDVEKHLELPVLALIPDLRGET
jgi:capsular polysaccharide biosynthesis protein